MSPADEVCLGDLDVVHQERLARFGDLAGYFADLGPDTVGHLRPVRPGHPRRRRRARVRVRDARRVAAVPGHVGPLVVHPPRPAPRRRHPRRRRPGQRRRRADAGLSGRVRRPTRRGCCGPDGWCCPTTTTGCPASRWRPTSRRSGTSWPAGGRAAELAAVGYVDGYALFEGLA